MTKISSKFFTIPVLCGLCSLVVLVTSCKPKHIEVIDEEITKDTLSEGTKNSLESISVNIPSPMEVTGEISGAGISFNKSIINPTSKASGYATNYQKALNLGVYGSDLGYVTGFKQMQEALGYVGTVKKLAEETGVSSAYDEPAIKKIVENLSKVDSADKTAALIKEVYQKAERNLRSHQRVEVAGLVITAGWIEGLYVATQALGSEARQSKNEKLYSRIWNQAYSFQYVSQLLNDNKKNPDFAKLLEELKDVEALCKTMENRPKMNNADVQQLKEKITIVRNKITG
jgi:uncharacterized protein YdcH (DUF465 family)